MNRDEKFFWSGLFVGVPRAYSPVARYYPDMDFLLYLNEDCSYRAERVDAFLTVLWHPYDDKLVGIKLKGFRFLFEQLRRVLDLKDDHWLPLVKFLELAVVGGVGETIMSDVEKERSLDLYEKARVVARDATIAPLELKK